MEIKILDQTNNLFNFEISGIDEVEANTIRRLLITETPTMAIEEIEFLKNDCILYDEILANRLGLIPLVTDLKGYNLPENCTCKGKGCSKCQALFSLESIGPKMVLSSELICKDKNIKVAFDKMPITHLLDKQELKIIATAKLGFGKTHIKHAPCAVFFSNKPILKINNNSKKFSEFKNKYPKAVFKDGKLDEKSLLKDNLYDACEGICEDILKIEYEKDKFIFNLESFGQLNPKEMLEAAIDSFNSKLDSFSKALKNTKPTIIKNIKNMGKKKSS
jgi:DNA-directed RNA polymerase subunit D